MSKEYYIKLDGKEISVTEDVYFAFKRSTWREHNRRRACFYKEISIEAIANMGIEIPSKDKPINEAVEDKLMLDMIIAALNKLNIDERKIIDSLFLYNKSEREIAREMGVSQPAVHKRRNRILKKLKKFLI